MAFGKLMKRLLGFGAATGINDAPFQSAPQRPPAPASPPPARPCIAVQREELIDERARIAGYRFTVRNLAGHAAPLAGERLAALCAENLGSFAQRRMALIALEGSDWAVADFSQFIPTNTHFLVSTPGTAENAGEWLETLQQIKEAGGHIAVDDAGVANKEAAALADLIVLDFRSYALDGFERLVRRLRRLYPEASIVADGIATWPEHRLSQSLGIRYSLGGFATAKDEEDKLDKLTQSRLTLIEMLNLLRNDAELAEISAVARRDPGIALKIVGMANSPVSGLSAPVASLDQAMMVLGRSTIYRWLSIAMFRAGSGHGHDEALLELALWRARFLECLVDGAVAKQECDELFLVGLLSLIDNLLGQPMAQVLGRMNLPDRVAEVLLDSGGPYGRFLRLAMAVERGRDEQALKIAADLELTPEEIETAGRAARRWTEEALGAV